MEEMSLRPAMPADVIAVAEIFAASRRLLSFLPELHSVAEDHAFIRDEVMARCRVTVAERTGQIVGFLAEGEGWVDHLYVAPDRLGGGVGARLLSVAQARQATLRLWCFARNGRARSFYEKHGFVAERFTDGVDNEAKAADVLYRWQRQA